MGLTPPVPNLRSQGPCVEGGAWGNLNVFITLKALQALEGLDPKMDYQLRIHEALQGLHLPKALNLKPQALNL